MDEKKIDELELYLEPEVQTSTENKKEKSNPQVETLQTKEKTKKKSKKETEIIKLRKENKKVFELEDGTQKAVFYGKPVHTLNGLTKIYDDVDCTIKEQEDGKYFVNENNDFVAKFNCEDDSDELFSIEKDEYKVTVYAKKLKKNRNQGVKPKIRKKDEKDIPDTDIVSFADVEVGSDYEYSIKGDGVKEDIVIKDKAPVYRYPFILRSENVTAQLNEESNSISFINAKEEEIFNIPAPFMEDADGNVSTAVNYEVKTLANGDVNLTVSADSEWINAEDRAFPVVIDPQIKVSGSSCLESFSWEDGNMRYTGAYNFVGYIQKNNTNVENRMYLKFTKPDLPINPRIKKAELELTVSYCFNEAEKACKVGLYHVTGDIYTGNCTPMYDSKILDYIGITDDIEAQSKICFDVTSIIDKLYNGEITKANLMIALMQQTTTAGVGFHGYNSTKNAPKLIITYETNYGADSSYRTHTHSLGRFGQGSVDLQCGNLMFTAEDFNWGGNRMPVSIKHTYNSALSDYKFTANENIKLETADFSAMNVGLGWHLNLMESMIYDSEINKCYYHDENGNRIQFKCDNEDIDNCEAYWDNYHSFVDEDSGEMKYDKYFKRLVIGETNYTFDSNGRLIRKSQNGNAMKINYTSGQITSVADGIDREFGFNYSASGKLNSIIAPDYENNKKSIVEYSYDGDLLNGIFFPDGRNVEILYENNKPSDVILRDESGNLVYKVKYTFNGDRVASVTEYGFENGQEKIGTSTTYSYSLASRRTTVTTTIPRDEASGETADEVITTVYTFNNDGNIISEYAYSNDFDKTQISGGAGINPYSSEMSFESNVDNLLLDNSFEKLDSWISDSNNHQNTKISSYNNESLSKFGKSVLEIDTRQAENGENRVYQNTQILPAGEYTFSCYTQMYKINEADQNTGAYLRVTANDGTVLCESERITEDIGEYIRLIAPFKIETEQAVKVYVIFDSVGIGYFDGAQLENNAYANSYNMISNSNFERGLEGWTTEGSAAISDSECFNMTHSLKLTGSLDGKSMAKQEIPVKSDAGTRESFTLSAWAKGNSLPCVKRDEKITTEFGIGVIIKYTDDKEEPHFENFSICTDEWQPATISFAKEEKKEIKSFTVCCNYNYNHDNGVAYFDNISLFRTTLETGVDAAEFGNEADDNDEVETTTIDEAPEFNEAKDIFGNALTETTFTDGEFGTIYRSFEYSSPCHGFDASGNELIAEIDARGNRTEYIVDEDTSKREAVVDRCKNKTEYEYDEAGRTSKVTSFKPQRDTDGKIMTDQDGNIIYEKVSDVSYDYDSFDNLTEIVRGDGLKYSLKYNAFHNLESIGIDQKTDGDLIKYTYKNGNGKLKEMTYANGDKMTATYNGLGQMIAEKWYNSSNELTAHYKYVYDGQGNIVRSIDILARKEYNYYYEEGKIVRATECSIEIDQNEIVTSKSILHTILYYYDSEGELVRKRIIPKNGTEQVIYYEKADDNTVVKFEVSAPKESFMNGKQAITSHSKNDSFGRKEFDELQLSAGYVSRKFQYIDGEITEEHKDNKKVKSSATTQLVSKIILSDGRTIEYEYDEEERITKVTDSVEGITQYTYDALGQLLTEKNGNGEPVNVMTYTAYGNIRTKNDLVYVYDSVWKDKLVAVCDDIINYDAQGNPTSYLGHNLTWEKGRQLKSFDGNTYTYNANGIRTSKTIGGIKHEYTLDGAKILRETWGDNTLVPLYDNEDSVCGITYNNESYFFLKNLQGDIIAITDRYGEVVARYSYDAWGVCTTTQDSTEFGISDINPFRYRSYYFDRETGLYYLQSRYYDPVVGRFINGDEAEVTTHSNKHQNSFTYCANNSVMAYDTLGYFPVHLVVGTVAGFIWGIAPRLLKMILFKQRAKLSDILCDGLAGAVGGLITSATGSSTLGTFLGTFVGEVVRYFVQERPFSSGTSFLTILINVFVCLIMAGIAALASFIAGKLVNKITKKKFSSKQIKQYFKQTKKLKSALGIGTSGKTARRMWYMDCGITTALSTGLNKVVDFIKEFLKKVMS